jgi:hypothetical protein
MVQHVDCVLERRRVAAGVFQAEVVFGRGCTRRSATHLAKIKA